MLNLLNSSAFWCKIFQRKKDCFSLSFTQQKLLSKGVATISKKEKIILSCVSLILGLLMFFGMIFLLDKLEWYIRAAVFACILCFTLGACVFFFLGRIKIAKSSFMLNLLLFIILLCFFLLNLFGIFENLSDMAQIKQLILDSGSFGVLICFLVILFNVIVLPAPSWIFYLAITAVYGNFAGFLICYAATVIGSVFAFLIGKKLGRRAVIWCIGLEDTEKYSSLLNKRGKMPFIMMQILPFFPDDILCMVAGLSGMSYSFFVTSIILVRPIYIAFVCFLGTGEIIPFHSWGIVLWAIIAVFTVAFTIIYYLNQEKIDGWFKKIFKRRDC